MREDNYKIVEEKVVTKFINKLGNVDVHSNFKYYFIKDEEENYLSNEYLCIEDLGFDHFAVATPILTEDYINLSYYDLVGDESKKIDTKIKWAIIRLNRDLDDKIIPGKVTFVTPFLYDRICANNLATATVSYHGKLTYVDIDINSQYYGKQLVPCVLNHASSFDVTYPGMAECSIEDVVGYLPRSIIAMNNITKYDLLTNKEVKCLISENEDNPLLHDTLRKYEILTGISLKKESDEKELKKVNKENN